MKKIAVIAGLVAIASMVFAGGQQEPAPAMVEEMSPWSWVIDTGDFPQVNALEVSGAVITAGSSTVFPAAEYLAAQFQDEGYSDNITIDSIGSGAGFERFTAGESDVSNASRAIKESEAPRGPLDRTRPDRVSHRHRRPRRRRKPREHLGGQRDP